MSKRFQVTETEIESIKKLYISEQAQKEEDRKFCHGGNVKSLEEIVDGRNSHPLTLVEKESIH